MFSICYYNYITYIWKDGLIWLNGFLNVYTDEVKYADARYVSKSTGNGNHTFKRVGLVYSDTEPIPDNVTKYKLEDVQKEKEREEREDSRDDTPTVISFIYFNIVMGM